MLAKVYDVKVPLELAYSSLIVHLNLSVGTQQETSKGAKTVGTFYFPFLDPIEGSNTDNMQYYI